MELKGLVIAFLYPVVALLAFSTVLVRPQLIPVLLVAVMPTGNFDVDWGVGFSLSKVVLIIFLMLLPAQSVVAPDPHHRLRIPASLWVFLLCAFLSTVASFWIGEVHQAHGFELLRGPQIRPVVQLISMGIRIAALVMILRYVTDSAAAARVFKAMVAASTLVAAYGLYQFAGFYAEWPIMGITRPQADLSGGVALFKIGEASIFRLGSFVGEPKEAAKFLLQSIVVIISVKSFSIVRMRSWLTSYPILVLHCLAFVLTFATSSLFAVVLSLPALAMLWLGYRGKLGAGRLATAGLMGALLMGAAIHVAGGTGMARQIFEARLTARVLEVDSPERATIELLKERPLYLVTGIGFGNSSFYLRRYYDPSYYRPLTVRQNSSYLQILTEGGVAALASFLVFLAGWLLRGFRLSMRSATGECQALVATATAMCLTMAAVNLFSSTDFNGQIWVCWGLLIALCRLATNPEPQRQRIPIQAPPPYSWNTHRKEFTPVKA